MDLTAAAHAQGLSLEDPAVSKLRAQLFAEHEQQQRALLGDKGYHELQGYERTLAPRELMRSLAAVAVVEGVPFSPQQIEQLIGLAASASSGYRKGGTAGTIDVDWDLVLEQSRSLLSERQFALVKSSEPPGGGIFHARWNAELVKATRGAKKANSPKG